MNPCFTALSAAYIFAIFFLAESPVVARINEYNHFSLLHIPLYGILTALLLLAVGLEPKPNPKFRYTIAALIAVGVGILDEYYQSFIPTREASVTDALLDALGVSIVMILAHRIPPPQWATHCQKLKIRLGRSDKEK